MSGARTLYRLQVVFGCVAFAAAAISAQVALGAVSLGMPTPQAAAAACRRWVPALTAYQALVLGMASFALVVCARFVRSLAREAYGSGHYVGHLNSQTAPIEIGGTPCFVAQDRKPQAFCAGLLRPRVYLSSGTLELLREPELHAVVTHEAYHAERRDPLRLAIARALADACVFAPVLRRLSERYAALSEVAADEAAVQATAGPTALATALLRFDEQGRDASASVGISCERVDALVGEERTGSWQIPRALLLGSVGTVSALLAIALAALTAAGPAISLPLLAAQSCMLMMIAAPLAATFGVLAPAETRASGLSASWLRGRVLLPCVVDG